MTSCSIGRSCFLSSNDFVRVVTAIFLCSLIQSSNVITLRLADCDLGVGETEYSRKPFAETKGQHDLALLSVNRLIGAEAKEIFYSSNTFRLNVLTFPQRYTNGNDNEKFWVSKRKSIRRVSVVFDFRDVSLRLLAREIRNPTAYNESWGSKQLSASSLHVLRNHQLEGAWGWKIHVLNEMNLKVLKIDLSNCYCTIGCCRLVEDLITGADELAPWHRHGDIKECTVRTTPEANIIHCDLSDTEEPMGLEDMEITMTGWESPQEKLLAHRLGFSCQDCPRRGNKLDAKACNVFEVNRNPEIDCK